MSMTGAWWERAVVSGDNTGETLHVDGERVSFDRVIAWIAEERRHTRMLVAALEERVRALDRPPGWRVEPATDSSERCAERDVP